MKNQVTFLKFFNIFSWLYLKHVRGKNVSLNAVHYYTLILAEKQCHSASMWDVFDGMCYMIAFVIFWIFLLPALF